MLFRLKTYSGHTFVYLKSDFRALYSAWRTQQPALIMNYIFIGQVPSYPTFQKLKKILKHNLTDFINKYKIISEYQYGFQEKKSTNDAH